MSASLALPFGHNIAHLWVNETDIVEESGIEPLVVSKNLLLLSKIGPQKYISSLEALNEKEVRELMSEACK